MDNKKIYKYLGISLLLSLIVILVVLVVYYSFNRNNTSKDKFENEGSYPFVSGNTIKITCQNCDNLPPPYNPANGSDVNLFGVFIYGKDGKLLNTEPSSGIAELSSAYGFTLPENALKYSVEYRSRILSEALIGQLPIDSRWEYNTLGYVSASGSTPSPGTNPGWWAYKFNSPQDISGIEIYSRSDNCAERISNALIQIFDSSDNELWRTNFRNITEVTGEYNRPVNPADVWETFNVIPSATTYSQPTTTYSQPTTTSPQPTTTSPQPTTTSPQPTTTAPQPTTTYSQPTTTSPQPTTTYSQPTTTYSQLSTTEPIITYQSVSCKYLVITAPAVNIAGLLIIDKYGNNMFYNADATKFNAFQLGNMETCANSILQTNKINYNISNIKMYMEGYSRLNIESNNIVSITNGQVGNSKIPNPVSNENAQLMIDLNPNNNDLVNINSIILIHNINTNCEINEPNKQYLPIMALPNMFNTFLNNMCSLGLIGGNISLYGKDFKPTFDNYVSQCTSTNNLNNQTNPTNIPTTTFTQQPKTLAKWYFPKYTSLVSQYTPSSTQELLQQSQQYYIPILSSVLTLNQISSFKNIHEKFVDMNTGIGILYPDPKVPITVNPGKSIDASNSIFSIIASNYTFPQPTNTFPQPTTTYSQPANTISISTIPLISPSQTIALLNTGANVDTLTSQGIAMNSAFRGPSTNIVQTNFSGTSNIYSPYLYYNKGLSESFSGNTTDTGKNYFTY
jgi:hypothetical protein